MRTVNQAGPKKDTTQNCVKGFSQFHRKIRPYLVAAAPPFDRVSPTEKENRTALVKSIWLHRCNY